jgi:hypothetical protein
VRIVSSYCALAFRDVDKSVKECGEYYDLAWYSIAALKLMDSINLSKTRIDFANEVCLGEVGVMVKDVVCERSREEGKRQEGVGS